MFYSNLAQGKEPVYTTTTATTTRAIKVKVLHDCRVVA